MRNDVFGPGHKEVIFKQLLRSLYNKPLALLRKEKDSILIRNMSKLGALAIGNNQTYFDGDWHILQSNDPRAQIVRHELDSEFHTEFRQNTAEFQTLESERMDITAYLKRMINISMTMADMYAVFPTCLHPELPNMPVAAGRHSKLTIDDAAHFLYMNRDAEQFVKQRMLTNLLMPRV